MARPQLPHVVVLLPGITGSALLKDGNPVWSPETAAVWRAVRTGAASIRDLAIVDDDWQIRDLGDGVTVGAVIPDVTLIPGFWKIDGYTKVGEVLRRAFSLERNVNYYEFPYDWRRDNRASARRLQEHSRGWLAQRRRVAPEAKLILVAHSMGGLVARYFLECLEGWRDTKALITFGTPYRGSLNALRYLAQGYGKSFGPVHLDLSTLLQSLTSVYQLLPIYPCVDTGAGDVLRVAEVDALPHIDAARAKAALAFHREIEAAQRHNAMIQAYHTGGYQTFPIVGTEQPTLQSGRVTSGGLELLQELDGKDYAGDGTVPRVSATPIELSTERREMFAPQVHGSLQNFDPVLHHVEAVIRGGDLQLDQYRAIDATGVRLWIEDAYADTEQVVVRARPTRAAADRLMATVSSLDGAEVARAALRADTDGWFSVELNPLPPGIYRGTVRAGTGASPVTDVFSVVETTDG